MTTTTVRPLLHAIVEGDPIAQPRARATSIGGHARMYDPGTARPWRERVWAAIREQQPETPHTGPLWLCMGFRLRRPKGHWTAKGGLRPKAPTHPTGKPDLDNLAKAVMDELTQGGFWRDDSQVVWMEVSKDYVIHGSQAGLTLILWPEHPVRF